MSKRRRHVEESKKLAQASKNTSKDKRDNKYNKGKKSGNSRSQFVALTLPILFALVCGFAIFLYMVDQQIIFKHVPSPSSVIIGTAKDIDVFLNVMKGHLHKIDPNKRKQLDEDITIFIKNSLNGIQQRLASLKIQTSQYEQMSVKISGGPKSFISSTEKELDSMMKDVLIVDEKILLAQDRSYRGRVLNPDEYSIGHLSFPKKDSIFSDTSGYHTLKSMGIFIWPESWETEDLVTAQQLHYEARTANISLLDSYKMLEAAGKILHQLGLMHKNTEEMFEEARQEFNLMKSNFPRLIALFFYHYGWKWYSGLDIWNMDMLLSLKTDDYEMMETYIHKITEAMAANKKFYDENEKLLRSISPLKYAYVEKAKEFVAEMESDRKNRRSKESGNLLMGYADLKTRVFEDLGELRKRVLKLAES